jgi:hypothetical protein
VGHLGVPALSHSDRLPAINWRCFRGYPEGESTASWDVRAIHSAKCPINRSPTDHISGHRAPAHRKTIQTLRGTLLVRLHGSTSSVLKSDHPSISYEDSGDEPVPTLKNCVRTEFAVALSSVTHSCA